MRCPLSAAGLPAMAGPAMSRDRAAPGVAIDPVTRNPAKALEARGTPNPGRDVGHGGCIGTRAGTFHARIRPHADAASSALLRYLTE